MQIDNLLVDEEIYWKQWSRADWLKERDKNTKFFHAKASARKRKNWIRGIRYESDKWTEEPEEIKRMFCDHFDNLFTTTTFLGQIRSSSKINASKSGYGDEWTARSTVHRGRGSYSSSANVPYESSWTGWISSSLFFKSTGNQLVKELHQYAFTFSMKEMTAWYS